MHAGTYGREVGEAVAIIEGVYIVYVKDIACRAYFVRIAILSTSGLDLVAPAVGIC